MKLQISLKCFSDVYGNGILCVLEQNTSDVDGRKLGILMLD